MSNEIQRVIIETLWKTWQDNPPTPSPTGDRLFVRSIDLNPKEYSWEEWTWVGRVLTDSTVKWLPGAGAEESSLAAMIQKGVGESLRFGELSVGTWRLQWGLFEGDGPEGQRTEDWLEDTQ